MSIWRQEWDEDPESLRRFLAVELWRLVVSYNKLDLVTCRTTIDEIVSISIRGRSEQYKSIFDTALAHVSNLLACAALARLDFDLALSCLQSAQTLLNAKKARRALLDMPQRPDSECWFGWLTQLADLKWLAPEFADALMTPREMLNRFGALRSHALAHLAEYPYKDKQQHTDVTRTMEQCACKLLCMAVRIEPTNITNYIDAWEAKIFHVTTCYYYEFEIARRWAAGTLDPTALPALYERRRKMMDRGQGADQHFDALDLALANEMQYISQHLRAPMEVVYAAS